MSSGIYQTFRMGVRHPKNGVITIASLVKDDKIFYGVSYCSPSEKQYSRKIGTQLAKQRMDENVQNDVSIPLVILKHGEVVLSILLDMLGKEDYPRWALQLIIDNINYPIGLKRYTKEGPPDWCMTSITVNSEQAKEQIMLACKYLHDNPHVDPNYIAVNMLAHWYRNPDRIIVQ